MTDKTHDVLFPCTGNLCRSIMAKALVSLPIDQLEKHSIRREITAIGKTPA